MPRRLPIDGADPTNVLTLRSPADSDAIKATFGAGHRLVIIGAGWIGLEVAAAAREAGTTVTVIEAAAQPLLAVLGEQIAQVFEKDMAGGGIGVDISPRQKYARGIAIHVENPALVDETPPMPEPEPQPQPSQP